jgi:hypothetical protein
MISQTNLQTIVDMMTIPVVQLYDDYKLYSYFVVEPMMKNNQKYSEQQYNMNMFYNVEQLVKIYDCSNQLLYK